jgi:hypothetical protein
MFQIEGRVVFTPDPVLWKQFTQSANGVVGSDLRRRGRTLAFLAAGSAGKRTGRLARSISVQYFPTTNPYVRVGSDLDHAYLHHEGTRPHTILPSKRETLRFKVRGRIVYAEKIVHPGTKATKFLSKHLRKVVND